MSALAAVAGSAGRVLGDVGRSLLPPPLRALGAAPPSVPADLPGDQPTAGGGDDPRPLGVPDGRPVELPGRGTTWVRELPGPPGAPTVVLLHGLGATGGINWRRAFPELGRRYRVIAIDHRGHGRGIRTPRFELADCADDVAALLEVLGVRRHVVVGYSMGGPIAMLLWRRHPELVDGVVLVATSHTFRSRPEEHLGFAALSLAGSLPLSPPAWLLDRLAELWSVEDPERTVLWTMSELRRHDPRSLLQAAAAVGRFTWPTPDEPIDVPVAVVATTHDRVVPLARQVRMALSIPSAVLHPVNSGHQAFTRFHEAEIVSTLLEACEEVGRRAHRHEQEAG